MTNQNIKGGFMKHIQLAVDIIAILIIGLATIYWVLKVSVHVFGQVI